MYNGDNKTDRFFRFLNRDSELLAVFDEASDALFFPVRLSFSSYCAGQRVGQNFVRFLNPDEPRFGFVLKVGVSIGVKLLGEPAICALDLLGRGVGSEAELFVVVLHFSEI